MKRIIVRILLSKKSQYFSNPKIHSFIKNKTLHDVNIGEIHLTVPTFKKKYC